MTAPYLLSQLVTDAAERDPEAPAVCSTDGALSYAELAERTERLAATLQHAGVRPGDRVGLFLHKSVAAVVAVHGILRCGAAYVPIDPFAPAGAVATIVGDCGIEVIVADDRSAAVLDAVAATGCGLRLVVGPTRPLATLTVLGPDAVAASGPLRPVRVLSQDLAYVMYTSGSTGRPKGLMHTHRSGLAYATRAVDVYSVSPQDRLANSAPFHFDISTFELFAGPLAGAMSLIIAEPYLKMPASLSSLVAEQRCTFWYSVPFLLAELLHRGALDQRDLSAMRWVLFGGEVADPDVIAKLMAHMPNARFSNSYGPAEVNQCTYHHLAGPPPSGVTIPIGVAWADAEVAVVDDAHEPVAAGAVGELLVRTATMMDGYWNRPDLNERAFVARDAPGGRQQRWYATGDLVQERPDGELEFLGRRDHQIKVRGNRIELESVEALLATIEGIEHAVAGVAQIAGTTTLVAGVAVAPEVDIDLDAALREVAAQLPPYAVPHRLIVLTDLPLTGSGKLDRRRVRDQLSTALSPEGVPT